MRFFLLLIVLSFSFLACEQQAAATQEEEATVAPSLVFSAPVSQGDYWTYTSFDGEQIAYTDEGSGPAVVLLHGFINDGTSWDRSALKPLLLQSGFRVIVPDLRGNGRSAKPQDAAAYTNNAEVKDLKLLIDLLDLQQFAVVGYSRGSIVMTQWLTEDPRIVRAVMGGMGADFLKPNWDRRLAFAAAFDDPPQVTELTSGALEYAKSVGADLRSLHLQQQYQPVPSASAMKAVQAPVFILLGQYDQENGSPMALVHKFGMAVMDIIPGEDHNSTYKSEAFAKRVVNFLNK